ncbi:hypothetical protein F5B22DRAFT_646074 [Xylaria bambusicola]|uniref:uncharacterized protein n=1 Tax=Xylaria bambusicola TaxID=326684 RepID=UPI00200734CA|nr:uncharacterized protein F5B22DRAFT_646074 [Xylaria bambusicola]KAI0517084.1 hypothetical protein F5B22DRAFT_646074 [Xylaria bambusicola]
MHHFRVAIVGGGLAGATLATALVQLSNMDVRIFESAPEFSERGAAVGLGINAQMALNEIISAPPAVALLDKAEGVPINTPYANFLFGLDMAGHKQDALDKMHEIQQKT